MQDPIPARRWAGSCKSPGKARHAVSRSVVLPVTYERDRGCPPTRTSSARAALIYRQKQAIPCPPAGGTIGLKPDLAYRGSKLGGRRDDRQRPGLRARLAIGVNPLAKHAHQVAAPVALRLAGPGTASSLLPGSNGPLRARAHRLPRTRTANPISANHGGPFPGHLSRAQAGLGAMDPCQRA